VNGTIVVNGYDENQTGTELEESIGFCTFELIDITNEHFDSVVWKLKANRDKLVEMDFDRDDIGMLMLDGDKWDKVKTDRVDGDSENFLYEAETDNFGEGEIALAKVDGGIFTLRNILICLGTIFGLILLGAVVYALMNREDKDNPYKSTESKTEVKTNKKEVKS
jgi:hypothetical protein